MLVERKIEFCGQKFHGGALTIGNYDGLHFGHQGLLASLRGCSGPKVVLTFDPHPVQVLQPDRHLKRLFPREDLIEQLPRFGIDLLLILEFDTSFAQLTAEAFLEKFVVGAFGPQKIVAGYDFAFGSGRQGSLEMLKTWAPSKGIDLEVVEPLRIGGEIVSSRRIRDMLRAGDVSRVIQLLGRPFYLRGEVVSGAGRGLQIGIPTLNQAVVNETLPKAGVYASRTRVKTQYLHSVTNIGSNPTFEKSKNIKVETHILDGSYQLRGEVVDVELIERLRDEKKFSNVTELQTQIQKDIDMARNILQALK